MGVRALPARITLATLSGLAMTARARSRRRARWRAFEAGLLLASAAMLCGCGSMIADNLPTAAGGLPAGTPARATAPPAYPPVHDRPAPRNETILSEQEQKWLEGDLARERDRAAAEAAAAAAAAAAEEAAAAANKLTR
jgi:hypothetical protein